jgi:integrase
MGKNINTEYKGVTFRRKISQSMGKEEKIFYVQYYDPSGVRHLEPVGSSIKGMTAAKANNIRSRKIEGKELTNRARRKAQQEEKRKKLNRWTVDRLWNTLQEVPPIPKRLKVDIGFYNKHLKDKFGNKTPGEIKPSEIDKLRSALEKKLKPATIVQVLGLLKKIINFGASRNYCQPLNFKIQMPTVDNQKTEHLTQEQLEKLLKSIDEDTNQLVAQMMKFVLYTGLRRGELFKLQWDDIDYERNLISIQDPKGKKSQTIPLNDEARKLLESLDRPFKNSPYVFPGRDGNLRTDAKEVTTRIRDRAGLPKDFRPLHGLRHSYASMLASSGKVDMYWLQKLLTHKSPQMTQRYAHLRDDVLKKASDIAGDIVSVATKNNEDRNEG